MPDKHAKISPSSFAAIAACPGRVNAIEALPPEQRESPDSKASLDGTRRHDLLDWKSKHPADPWPTQLEDGRAINSDDVRAVQRGWDAHIKDHPARRLGAGRLWHSEEQLEVGKYLQLPEGLVWGTSDQCYAYPGVAEIADAKFGQRLVSPDCWQLKLYGIGWLPKLMTFEEGRAVFKPEFAQTKTLRLTILQPTAPEVVRSADFPLVAVEDWMREAKEIVNKALDFEAPRIPGEDQCRWCPANLSCPERLAMVTTSVDVMFDKAPEHSGAPEPIASVDKIVDISEVKMTQDPQDLTPEEVSRILDQAPLIEGFLKDVRARAQKMLGDGNPIPGWKLVEGKRGREWALSEDALLAEFKRMRLSQKDCYTRKLITPAQAEKIDKLTSKKNKEQLGNLWRWKAGKPSLAPESDPAPAVDSAHPQEMFEEVRPETPEPAAELPAGF